MKDILSDLDQWMNTDQAIAIATVIQSWGSAPQRAGSKMGITAQGAISGSVSGGCVEAGLGEAQLNCLRAPIGLAIQVTTPEEIAFSIMAKIIATWRNS